MTDLICDFIEKFIDEPADFDAIEDGLKDLGFAVGYGKNELSCSVDGYDPDDDESDHFIMKQTFYLAKDGRSFNLYLFYGNQTDLVHDFNVKEDEE